MQYSILGEDFAPVIQLPFARKFNRGELVPIDLSTANGELPRAEAMDLNRLTDYVDSHIKKHGAAGAWGGYGEKRDIYRRSGVFAESETFRNIHLGIDFWLPAGTEVAAPLTGQIHSFADNDSSGDYGPTIILKHRAGNLTFYSLYGHLNRAALTGLKKGQYLHRGEVFAELGQPEENKDWPPHLHFQLMLKTEGMRGDYPGVCFESEREKYLANCPDPVRFLGWEI